MSTSDDGGYGLNTVEANITLIAAVIGTCICCCLFWCFLWRRNRKKMEIQVTTRMAGLENLPTSSPFYSDRRDEAENLHPHWKLMTDARKLGNNEQIERSVDDWDAKSFGGSQPIVVPFTEDEHFSDYSSPPYSQKHQNFIDGGMWHRHNIDEAASWEAEEIFIRRMIEEDATSSSTLDPNPNTYPDIGALNSDVSFKINGNFMKKHPKLFGERATASATAGNDVGSETTGTLATFPSSRAILPRVYISQSGSQQRYEDANFEFEAFSPMNREHSFEIPDRPQSRRSKKSEETYVTPQEQDSERVSYPQQNTSWPSEETDNSRFTSQSVLRMRSTQSRTAGYSCNSKASCFTLGSESLQPWEDFSEDGKCKRPYDVPTNPQVRRAKNREEAHNGRTSREPERSIVLGMAENGSRNRNRGAPTLPLRYSNGRSNPQLDKNIDQSSATNTVHLGLPRRYNRGSGTKASKQQLSSEDEETLNKKLRAGGAGLRKSDGAKRRMWLPSENEHNEPLSQNANINLGQLTQTRVDRSVGTLESRQRSSSLQTAEEEVSEPSVHDSEFLEKSPKREMMPKNIEIEKGFR